MSVSILEQAKIQAQVLVPLLKAFQAELGAERANEIARKALASWAYKMGKEVSSQGTGTAAERMAAVLPVFSADDAHDIEVLKQTPEAFEFNVTRCRYAQFYKELGEPELGFLFLCSQDFPLTEGFSPDLELVRTQTIMQGVSYCDSRWRMKGKGSQT
jgi:hypothetical protein